jgi:flavin-dependent dehydrogenase
MDTGGAVSPQSRVGHDVIIIGGALAGAATALQLKRRDPSLRVLVIEKSTSFKRRVGEATTEVSGWFLTRVLGLSRHLATNHIPKNGLRFWFSGDEPHPLGKCSETGGRHLSSVPSFLVDRSILDSHLLGMAVEAGAELLRPARVVSTRLVEGGDQTVHVDHDGTEKHFSARWIVDASGIKAELARANDWISANTDHPTMAVWSRWRHTRDWDAPSTAADIPDWQRGFFGLRGTATNHFVGDGWWAWWIQLGNGDVSIGAVLDQRRTHWPRGGTTVGDKLRTFLSRHSAARAMLEDAEFIEGDVHFRRNLPYHSTRQCGDGFVLVGDASAFLDPLYSPGMDWIAYTTAAATELVTAPEAELAARIDDHNTAFVKSYLRMFEALYRDKYDHLGDHELAGVFFRLDIASYYLYVAGFLYRLGPSRLPSPPFSRPESTPFYNLMRLCNRRLAAMGRDRRRRGTFGRRNTGHRDLVNGFNFRPRLLLSIILHSLLLWLRLECREGWRTWFRATKTEPATPTTASLATSATSA